MLGEKPNLRLTVYEEACPFNPQKDRTARVYAFEMSLSPGENIRHYMVDYTGDDGELRNLTGPSIGKIATFLRNLTERGYTHTSLIPQRLEDKPHYRLLTSDELSELETQGAEFTLHYRASNYTDSEAA